MGSWSDLKDCFDYPGLHHFFHLINFSLFKIIGKSLFGWYLVLATLHGINGFLIYIWVRRMISVFQLPDVAYIQWLVPVLFLFSPYAIEPVVWKACMHYLLSVGFIVGGLILLLEYLQHKRGLWKVHLLFLLALLSLEISLAAPFIYLLFWVFYTLSFKTKDWIDTFIKVTLPQLGLLVLYFLANKWCLGSWVGHYGAESHLNFDLPLMAGNAFSYLGKQTLFLHYLPFKLRLSAYELINEPLVLIALIALSLVMVIYYVTQFLRNGNRIYGLTVSSFIFFFFGLFPIANLYFFKLQWYENDRYGYLASVFLSLFIALIFCHIKKKWLRHSVIFIYLAVMMYCSLQTLKAAYKAGNMMEELVDDFNFYDRSEIFILAIPDNINGLQMFRDYSGNSLAFVETLYHYTDRQYEGTMTEIAQINVLNSTDRIGVEQVDSLTFKVKNPQNGSWFWKDGIGMANYETDQYTVTNHGWYYLLKFKELKPNRTFLYFDNLKWKEAILD